MTSISHSWARECFLNFDGWVFWLGPYWTTSLDWYQRAWPPGLHLSAPLVSRGFLLRPRESINHCTDSPPRTPRSRSQHLGHVLHCWCPGLTLRYSGRYSRPRGFPGGSEGKVSAYNAGDLGLIPGSGRSPGEGNGNPFQYSCLENPMDGEAWQATVHGVTESRRRQKRLSAAPHSTLCSMTITAIIA